MTKMIRKHPGLSLTIIVAVLAVAFATGVVSSRKKPEVEVREIVLVAKDMMFHTEQQPEVTNPHVQLKKGEAVSLTIVNEEPGRMLHCFAVPGLRLKTTSHLMEGESETIVFTPKKKGVFSYTCMLHPMMTGKISVD